MGLEERAPRRTADAAPRDRVPVVPVPRFAARDLEGESSPERLLAGMDRDALIDLLDYAVAHGWTCLGLLQFVRTH